jgi:hypothetical protein
LSSSRATRCRCSTAHGAQPLAHIFVAVLERSTTFAEALLSSGGWMLKMNLCIEGKSVETADLILKQSGSFYSLQDERHKSKPAANDLSYRSLLSFLRPSRSVASDDAGGISIDGAQS